MRASTTVAQLAYSAAPAATLALAGGAVLAEQPGSGSGAAPVWGAAQASRQSSTFR